MNKPWLNQYPEGMPTEIEVTEYSSISDFFEQTVQKYPQRPALANMGTTISYSQVEERSRYLANYFRHELKLTPGTRVAIMMPNLLQDAIAILGTLRAGLIAVNVNPLYTPRELQHQLNDSGAEVIVVLENFAHVVADVIDKTSLKHVVTTEMGDQLKFPKSKLVNFIVKWVKRMVPKFSLNGRIRFNEALASGSNYSYEPVNIGLEDTAFLQYTGGTTGVCKSAVLTHRNLLTNMLQATAWISYGAPQGKEVQPGKEIVIAALPLYHIFSLTANFLTFMNLGGLIYLITNPRDYKGFVKELDQVSFSCIPGVNTLFNQLIDTPGFTELDFSSLKITLGGGMPIQTTLAERWKQATGSPIIEAYGLTETSPAVCINPLNQEHHIGSIGLPISSTDCCIRDDNGKDVPLGEIGELCIRGPQVMKQYWNRPEETKNVFYDDGWLKTGDIAKISDEGYIYLVDRKKDMILVSGFNVFPNEIESVISAHPDVMECGVIGIADDACGEAAKAFIVKRNPKLTEDDILAYCQDKMTAYKIPKSIKFVDDLPKSNIGKILRRELRSLM